MTQPGSGPRARKPTKAGFVQVAASPAGMRRLVDTFGRFAARHGIPPAVQHDMYVALDEVLSNAVRHGRRDGHGRIELGLALSGGTLEATITDNGAPFNPLDAPRPRIDQPLLERPIGGLGILLITELMDAVSYRRQGDRNCLVLKKKIPS